MKRAAPEPPGLESKAWQSPTLQAFGIRTDRAYHDLVRRARKALLFTSKVQAPDAKVPTRMQRSATPGLFVRKPEDRLVAIECECDEVEQLTCRCMARHCEAACATETRPPAWQDLYSIPPDVEAAVGAVLNMDLTSLAQWRQGRIHELRSIATKAASLSTSINRGRQELNTALKISASPPECVSRLTKDVNIAFICVMIDAMEYPDTSLPWLLASGMPVAGDLTSQTSRVFRPVIPTEHPSDFGDRWREFNNSHDAWLQENKATSLRKWAAACQKASQGGASSRQDAEVMRRVWRATQVEVIKGLMGPAMTETELYTKYQREDGSLSCRVIPRFGAPQGETPKRCPRCDLAAEPCTGCAGQTMTKIRCCDNAKESGTNAHTRMGETVVYPSFEFPARVAASVFAHCTRKEQQRPGLLYSLDDLFAAYRRVGTSQPQFTVV